MVDKQLTEREFAQIICDHGGRAYRVGGCVRDQLRGVAANDRDFCVTGMVKKIFKQLFPAAIECGKSFPVFRLTLDGEPVEVAFARTERKTGSGYKGFTIASNPRIGIEADLARRDTTVNAMAQDCLTGEIIDPFAGAADINAGLLRAVGEHFGDDPVRAVRLAGQAARLNYQVDPATLTLAARLAPELANEPIERLVAELTKVLTTAAHPARFFRVLAAADLLAVVFPVLAALPDERWQRLLTLLDAVAALSQQPRVRFATLGLVLTEAELRKWNDNMTLPGDWLSAAITAGKVSQILSEITAATVLQALNSLRRGALDINAFTLLAKAIAVPCPPLDLLQLELNKLAINIPVELRGQAIGAWVYQQQLPVIDKALEKYIED